MKVWKSSEEKRFEGRAYYWAHRDEERAEHKRYYWANREKVLFKQREWRLANKETLRLYDLRRNFGITYELYSSILGNQLGVCAICCKVNPHGKFLGVDHDHKTGEIRGLLCDICNMAVGIYENRKEEIETYLEI